MAEISQKNQKKMMTVKELMDKIEAGNHTPWIAPVRWITQEELGKENDRYKYDDSNRDKC